MRDGKGGSEHPTSNVELPTFNERMRAAAFAKTTAPREER
jgi:hypothetical protein